MAELITPTSLQLAPWLAAEVPHMIEKGLIVHKEETELPATQSTSNE
jgi:hypothetical protein